MKLPTIFISYNPNSELEQVLAVRLHTLGAVHGFNMLLPDRDANSVEISPETKSRIKSSDYFILFSTSRISPLIKQEIEIAASKIHDKSKILIVYDVSLGVLNHTGAFTQVLVDRTWPVDKIVDKIIGEIKKSQINQGSSGGFLSALGGILLTGVALYALSSLFDDEAKGKAKRLPVKRKKSSVLRKVRS